MNKKVVEELEKILASMKKLTEEAEQPDDELCDEDDIVDEVGEEYNEFLKWAIGDKQSGAYDTQEIAETWTKLHRDLPLPRILMSKQGVSHRFSMIFFMMDAYPFYLEHLEKINS